MMRTWAVECAKLGVTVNAVVPTALTRMAATIPGLARYVEDVDAGRPLPHQLRAVGLGRPDDVAPLVVFLASAASAGVTGQAIAVGGDRIALWSHPTEQHVQVRPGGWDLASITELFTSGDFPAQDHTSTAPRIDL